MNKTDRLIVLLSLGLILLSTAYTVTTVRRQNIQKENVRLTAYEKERAETVNVKIWRKYHEDEKALLKEIVKQLRKNQAQCL